MKRTPPKPNNEPLLHHNSEPEVATTDSEQAMARITLRQKRKHSDQSLEMKSLRDDIMSSLETLRKEQQEKFSEMQSNLDQIKVQNTELKDTVDFLSGKYDDLMCKLSLLEKEKKSTLEYIEYLEDKVEIMERNLKTTSLEIRNVPKNLMSLKTIL